LGGKRGVEAPKKQWECLPENLRALVLPKGNHSGAHLNERLF